jgi:hypothetical protein
MIQKALCLFLITLAPAFAQALEVVKVERDQFELKGNSSELTVNQFLVVLSTDQMQPIAYAYITQIDGSRILAKPQSSLNSKQILVGDTARVVDLQKNQDSDFKGNAQLVMHNQRNISRRYKPLLYLGDSSNPTSATLAKGEHSINLAGYYHYGIKDNLMIGTAPIANFIGSLNLETKLRLHQSADYTVSLGARGTRTKEKDVAVFSVYLSIPTNNRFTSHTALSVLASQKSGNQFINRQIANGNADRESSLQNGTEFILNNWHRIVFGPQFFFNPESIGGFWAYHYIWNKWELSLGVRTRSFTDAKTTNLLVGLGWRL